MDTDASSRDTELSAESIASGAVLSHSIETFLGTLGLALKASQIGAERIFVSLQTLHPAFRARTYLWENTSIPVKVTEWPHGLKNRPGYYESPDFHVHESCMELRIRNLDKKRSSHCDLYGELAEAGYTDYLMMPLLFSDGTVNTLSIATKNTSGFASRALSRFHDLTDVFTIVFERFTATETVGNALDTYFGRGIRNEILSGHMRAGYAASVNGAILFADLNDFTEHAARMDANSTVKLLNKYFDSLVAPIEERGGFVLKFIGDAVLAFFPLSDGDNEPDPTGAVREIQKKLGQLNRARRTQNLPRLGQSLCVHCGTVFYGNVGSSTRLDFTIIGEAVNIAARGAEVAKALKSEYLFTDSFVERFGALGLEPAGHRRLRGIARPVQFYNFVSEGPTTGNGKSDSAARKRKVPTSG